MIAIGGQKINLRLRYYPAEIEASIPALQRLAHQVDPPFVIAAKDLGETTKAEETTPFEPPDRGKNHRSFADAGAPSGFRKLYELGRLLLPNHQPFPCREKSKGLNDFSGHPPNPVFNSTAPSLSRFLAVSPFGNFTNKVKEHVVPRHIKDCTSPDVGETEPHPYHPSWPEKCSGQTRPDFSYHSKDDDYNVWPLPIEPTMLPTSFHSGPKRTSLIGGSLRVTPTLNTDRHEARLMEISRFLS